MKSKCSDHVYLKSKSLKEEEYDLKDTINTVYRHKNDLLNIIVEERNNDPIKEIHEIEDKVYTYDPIRELLPENKEYDNTESENKPVDTNRMVFAYVAFHAISTKFRLHTAHEN